MDFAEDKAINREAEEMSDAAPATTQGEVPEVDQSLPINVVEQEDDMTGQAPVTVRAQHSHPVKPGYEKEDEAVVLRDNEIEQCGEDSDQPS